MQKPQICLQNCTHVGNTKEKGALLIWNKDKTI